LLAALLLAACGGTVARPGSAAISPAPAAAFVVRRGWHTDVGFAADAVHGPLAQLAGEFPGARYLLFGFGDRRYLLSQNKVIGSVLAVLWPQPGLILVTALKVPPAEAFGADNAVPLALSQEQVEAMADFVWRSLRIEPEQPVRPYADGPYTGSLYYASTRIYAGVRTCNTWTAQALSTAGLPVDSFGVLFAGQVWTQVLRLRTD
jgi:hypothetical protein